MESRGFYNEIFDGAQSASGIEKLFAFLRKSIIYPLAIFNKLVIMNYS